MPLTTFAHFIAISYQLPPDPRPRSTKSQNWPWKCPSWSLVLYRLLTCVARITDVLDIAGLDFYDFTCIIT